MQGAGSAEENLPSKAAAPEIGLVLAKTALELVRIDGDKKVEIIVPLSSGASFDADELRL